LGAILHTHYGLAITAVTFLPLGQDSSAWVYRVQTANDAAYFLKVRTRVANAPGLLVPRFLQDHGVAPVIAPLPTTTGSLWAEGAGYALILYPFIAGTTGMAHGMADHQWITYGSILRQIHATALAPELTHLMRRETHVPEGAAVRAVEAYLGGRTFADPRRETSPRCGRRGAL
jgi:spectinomycin phosphotransferase